MKPAPMAVMPRPAAPSSVPVLALALAASLLAFPARAQLVHRGATGGAIVTQTVDYLDTWERGGSAQASGARDVISRVEKRSGEDRSVNVSLLLHGPWGVHLYAFEESSRVTQGPQTTARATTWRAIDLDEDGVKELVFIERKARVAMLSPDADDPTKLEGPFFDDFGVRVWWLQRTSESLLEHQLDEGPDSRAFATLLASEFGGAVNAALQVLAGDFLFNQAAYEKARYRYQVAREWAERELPGRDAARLSPDMPLLQVDPDEPAFTWIQCTRRMGSLPAWYQR